MARTKMKVVTTPVVDDSGYSDIPFVLPSEIAHLSELHLQIMGVSPLLTHSPLPMLAPKDARGSHIPTPEVEAEGGTYRDAHGVCCVLGVMFQRTLLEAASAFRAKGRLTMQSYLAHIEVAQEFLPLIDPRDRSPLTTYEIDKRSAIVQRARILRARPRFDHWAVGCVTIRYDAALLQNQLIIPEIMADAGLRRGIGDNRPGKSKGANGRFAVIGVRFGDGLWERYQPAGALIERVEEGAEVEEQPL